jgi:2-amino-4-hydroxy-6-hydroxymethyldihydropteridine diphosphokinase
MNTHTVYLGLGANEPPAARRIAQALEELSNIPGLVLDEASPVYRTEPQLYSDQPWFSNQVARFFAGEAWEPVPLMRRILELETALGRVRSDDPNLRYGPRAIDIDMLLFDGLVLDDPVCTLPHPRLRERAFWLVPLRDIAPDLQIQGVKVGTLLEGFRWISDGDRIWQ